MNGSFYPNSSFESNNLNQRDTMQGSLPMEQSYIENILRSNIGKKVKAYFSYSDARDWTNKIYTGIIEQAGRDHLIISDPQTGVWYLLKLIYLDYVEFVDKIKYGL
ncbi:MAG: spore coat protein GerQ [Bacilli bacterium]